MRLTEKSLLITLFIASVTILSLNYQVTSRTLAAKSASQLYGKHCAECHGKDGRAKTSKGKYSHARDLTETKWQDDVSDERIFNSIMNGRNVRGNMPAFSDKLSQQDAEALVTLVRRFKK